jgi:hypothetical protein
VPAAAELRTGVMLPRLAKSVGGGAGGAGGERGARMTVRG